MEVRDSPESRRMYVKEKLAIEAGIALEPPS
jgi:hypothetical protein